MGTGRIAKGSYGYIRAERKHALIRTLIYLAVTLCVFFFGLMRYGNTRSVCSIIAAVLCLPLGLSAVNLIMFLKSVPLSDEAYRRIEERKHGLLIRYELMMTSEEATYPVGAVTVVKDMVRCYVEAEKTNLFKAKKHIELQLNLGGHTGADIALTKDIDEFLKMLDEAEDYRLKENIDPFREEEEHVTGTKQTAASVLRSISL